MFNEVFFFFYMVHIIGVLADTFIITATLGTIVLLFICGFVTDFEDTSEYWPSWRRFWKVWFSIMPVLFIVGILLPPKEALYAGAGYYVAEQTEMTTTLMDLKDVLDLKIEELKEESSVHNKED